MIPRNAKYKRFDEEKEELFFQRCTEIYIYIIYKRRSIKKRYWKFPVSLVKSRKIFLYVRGQCANRLLDRASSKAITIDTRSTRKKKKKRERNLSIKSNELSITHEIKLLTTQGSTFAHRCTRFMGPGDKEVTYQVLQIDVPTHDTHTPSVFTTRTHHRNTPVDYTPDLHRVVTNCHYVSHYVWNDTGLTLGGMQ